METANYSPDDVARATRLAKALRERARLERREAIDVDSILREVSAIALGAREYEYGRYASTGEIPRPTPDGIKHVALVTDAVRSREHALTRMASTLEVTACWLEEMAKFNAPAAAPVPALVEATTTADVASEG